MSEPGKKQGGLVGDTKDNARNLERLAQSTGQIFSDIQRPTYYATASGATSEIATNSGSPNYLPTGDSATWTTTVTPLLEVNVPPSTELFIELQANVKYRWPGPGGMTAGEYGMVQLVDVTSSSSINVLRYHQISLIDNTNLVSYHPCFMTARITPPANKMYRVGVRVYGSTTGFWTSFNSGYQMTITPRIVRAGTANAR